MSCPILLSLLFARFLVCVVVYYCSDIKICGEGGGAGGRAADQRGAGAAAAARHLGLQRADSKICSTDWNRLRVCRSALVETWPMLGLSISSRDYISAACCLAADFTIVGHL